MNNFSDSSSDKIDNDSYNIFIATSPQHMLPFHSAGFLSSATAPALCDGPSSSSLQLQGSQSPAWPSEKQVSGKDTLSHRQELKSQNGASLSGSHGKTQSAIGGATSATGSHNSSLAHDSQRSIIGINLPSKPSTVISSSSSSKPTYAAVVANLSPLPAPTKAAESNSSATAVPFLTDGWSSSSLQVQGLQIPPSPSEKQVITSNDTMVPTSQQEVRSQNGAPSLNGGHGQPPQSATRGSTSAETGSHQPSLSRRNTQRIHNVNVVSQNHHHQQHHHGRNMPMPPRGGITMFARPPQQLLLPPPRPRPLPPPASYSYPQYFPQQPVPPHGMPSYGFPADFDSYCCSYATPILPPPPFLRFPYKPSIQNHTRNYLAPDRELHAKILKQVNYYFSHDNLITDTYLRKHMDHEGWVTISVIAGFPKMRKLTSSIQTIIYAVRASSVTEISGDKIRLRDENREKWILSDSFQIP